MAEHLFLSTKGGLLPHWRETFPEAKSALLSAVAPATPDIVWVRLPRGEPVASLFAQLRRRFGDRPIVALSDRPDDEEALACFSAAAKGYCNSHAQPPVLAQVAGVVSQGGLWIGTELMQRLIRGTAALPAVAEPPTDWSAGLTEREREVARAVASGASNKEIARRLGITERTVKAHTGAIFEKLGVRDRLQLSLTVHGRRAG